MTDTATATKAPIKPARLPAREPATGARPSDRDLARPGALTFKHPVTGEVLVRDPRPTSDSPYHIPAELVPDGMTYQWKRESTLGERDVANMTSLARNGWREVPADRHPDRPTRMEGLVLMECPTMFVDQSRREEREAALSEKRKQLRPRNEALRPGYFDDRQAGQANFGARRGRPEPSDPSLQPRYTRDVAIDE